MSKPCLSCSGDHPSRIKAKCRVCQLVDDDQTVKPVWLCKKCNAYLCADDRAITLRAIARRIQAAIQQFF